MDGKRTVFLAALLLSATLLVAAQSPDRFVGTIQNVTADPLEVLIKPDSGDPRAVKLIPQSIFQRVAPGEKDLKKAVSISAGDLAAGDRVLVTLEPGTSDVRRLIVMSATDITKKNEADRQDWLKRGVSGVVVSKKNGEMTVKTRSMAGETEVLVAIESATKFRRYAPDSVRFADAKSSSLSEISVGDQLRARGQKNDTGTRVVAEEVVFGTFVTKAGKVTAVDAAARELTVLDSSTNKPLTIKLTADSQVKKMFSSGGGAGGFPGGGPPGGGSPAGGPLGGGRPESPMQRGMQAGEGRPRMGGGPMGGMRPPDLTQMLERMPAVKLEDIQPGETIVVSSTKGATKDHVTAIMMVTNAEGLIRMAAMQQSRSQGAGGAMNGPGMGAGGMGMGGMPGIEGMQLPGMMP